MFIYPKNRNIMHKKAKETVMVRTKKKNGKSPNPETKHSEFAYVDRWWEVRASQVRGRDSTYGNQVDTFASAEDLWQAACEYFAWMEARPQYEARPFQYKGSVTLIRIPKRRPYTLKGLLIFLNISIYVWGVYKQDRGPAYAYVCEQIGNVIYQQKFEGAAVDLFNASIIARDLGLKEQQEISTPDSNPLQLLVNNQTKVDVSNLTDEELDTIIKAIDTKKGVK